MDLSDGAKITTSRGGCPGADAKVFDACGKKFCGRYISPWTAETGCGYLSPRKVRQRGAGRRSGGRRENQRHQALCLTPRLLHRRGAMSAGYGATGRRIRLRMLQAGFYVSDRSVSPKPRQRVQCSLAGAPAGVS
ncbi:hypothetical protein GIZ46_22575 [Salmonella enterica]|nr:hypothetical protein [Salmonella enterica]